MIRLYSGSGSQEVELDGMSQAREEWVDIRRGACDLLRIRGAKHAAKLLEEIPFDLYDGTNLFGDKFSLLYLNTSVKQYVKFEEQSKDFQYRAAYKQIADTFLEIGSPIRFVVVNLEPKSSPSVSLQAQT